MFTRVRAAALAVLVGTSLGLVVVGSDPAAVAAKKPPKPVISKVNPKVGATTGGTVVKIKGKNLRTTTKVLFGKAKGTGLKVKSDHKITVVAPPHAAGGVDVKVKTKGGKSAKSSTAHFTYAEEKPTVTSVSPASGPSAGGTVVTVTGTGFIGVTGVHFDGVAGSAVSVSSPTRLTVTSPAHLPQVTHIDVTNHAGTSPHKTADIFRYFAVPRSSVAPVPPGAALNPQTKLADVTCPPGGMCTAVGYYFAADATRHPLIEQRTGDTSWSATDPALPAGADASNDAQFYAVSCPTASFCGAVGSYKSGGKYLPLVTTWNGTTWSAPQGVTLPLGGNGANDHPIDALDCPGAGVCFGVGSDYTGAVHRFLVLTLASGAWTVSTQMSPVLVPGGPVDAGPMVSISCASTTSCVAVGSGDGGGEVPVIASLSGGLWTSTSPPLPATADTATPSASLEAVDCTSPTTCTAVGDYRTTDGKQLGMIQQQAATPAGWTQQFIGAPTGSATDPDIKLHAVSCVTGFSCAAVGEFSLADATSRPMLARLSAGGGLGFDTGPVPPGAADEFVSDVTCATASACAAVGTHSNSAPSPLLENLIGVTWSAQVAPTPTGGTSSFLEQVAAEERTAVGVGRFTDSSGHTQGLITVDIPLT